MASYTISCPGNTALQTEVWTLTVNEATRAMALMETHKGSYWDTHLVKPTRRAKRSHLPTVRIYTAGFSSGEFSNVLYASGSTVERG